MNMHKDTHPAFQHLPNNGASRKGQGHFTNFFLMKGSLKY